MQQTASTRMCGISRLAADRVRRLNVKFSESKRDFVIEISCGNDKLRHQVKASLKETRVKCRVL